MHLILTGATGLVGSAALDAMLKTREITKISVLSRRPVQMADDAKDPRVRVILHKDFERYPPEVLKQLNGADGCVWALGVSQNHVSKEQYVKTTRDFPLAAALAFSSLKSEQDRFRFIYVSGEGATQTPGYFSPFYAGVKGATEASLGILSKEKPGIRVDSVRPGFVDPVNHTAIQKYLPESGVLKTVGMTMLFAPVQHIFKSMHTPTEPLGKFLTDMAMGKLDGKIEGAGALPVGSGWVVQNVGMRRIANLEG